MSERSSKYEFVAGHDPGIQSVSESMRSRVAHLPCPEAAIEVDKERKNAWVGAESDPRFRAIRQTLVDQVQHISFDDFLGSLETLVRVLRQRIVERPDRYCVLLDYKPHASKRWVVALAEALLEQPLALKTYFGPSAERAKGFPTLAAADARGVDTFVIMDDAIYSGEQVYQRAIKPVLEYAELHALPAPSFVVVAPYVTASFLQKVKQFAEKKEVRIDVQYRHIMLTVHDVLSEEQRSLLANEREGRLSMEDEDVFYQRSTLTYFDHRVADDHSFCGEVQQALGIRVEKPYGKPETEYYQKEEVEFQHYKDRVF